MAARFEGERTFDRHRYSTAARATVSMVQRQTDLRAEVASNIEAEVSLYANSSHANARERPLGFVALD